jgi:peptide-methionine (S)-S-oxide reductase
VVATRVGYTGGTTPNATYRNHGSHAEAIEIVYDPSATTYRDLLEFFFQIHDPSTKNRQGNDTGASYRSAIFYLDDEQRRVAEGTIADVGASGLWPGKAVTEVTPAGPFWEPNPSTRTTCCTAPTATPANSRDRDGCCRGTATRCRSRPERVPRRPR